MKRILKRISCFLSIHCIGETIKDATMDDTTKIIICQFTNGKTTEQTLEIHKRVQLALEDIMYQRREAAINTNRIITEYYS